MNYRTSVSSPALKRFGPSSIVTQELDSDSFGDLVWLQHNMRIVTSVLQKALSADIDEKFTAVQSAR